jgi:hypothetical protein
MGYGAIIGAIGSIVGGALSAAGSGSGGGPKPQKVDLSTVSLQDPNAALGQYAYQGVQLPGVEQTANQADILSNQAYQRNISQLYPGATSQISQISNLASSYLSGIIPQDVQDQIQRATAQQSLQGGYGGTQMARNLTARDLGLTSMNLQQLGMGMTGTGIGLAKGLTPSFTPISSLLFTPSQLLARTDQANYYNTDVKNQQNIINSGQIAAAQAAKQAQGQRQQAGISSMISSLFGSGGGSGSGSGGLLGGIMSLFNQGNSSSTTSFPGGGGISSIGGADIGTLQSEFNFVGA